MIIFHIVCALFIVFFKTIQSQCPCGQKYSSTRIIGGVETEVNEYPWQAVLLRDGSPFCGGSLLSSRFVLTAAHCFGRQFLYRLTVRLGEHKLSTSSESSTQEASVRRIYVNRKYNHVRAYDIALLKLTKKIKMSQTVMPICLPFNYAENISHEDTVTVTGWGVTAYPGNPSNVLKEAQLMYLTTEYCQNNSLWGQLNMIDDNMICAYQPNETACYGDSGGPLVWQNPSDGLYFQYGIVSWGTGSCTPSLAQPSVFTKVVSFFSWINAKKGLNACVITPA